MKTENGHTSTADVHEFFLDEELILFSGLNRNLYRLNTTAAFIWCHHAEGFSPHETIRALTDAFRVPAAKAEANVRGSLSQWRNLGLLDAPPTLPHSLRPQENAEPIPPSAFLRPKPPLAHAGERRYQLAGTGFQVCFATPEIEAVVHPLFAHLEAPRPAPIEEIFALVQSAEGFLIWRNSVPFACCQELRELAPLVHGELLATVCKSAECLAVIHAAAVTKDNHAILFPGDSGSGKSTLAAALITAGYGYLSDEIALLTRRPHGITPVPLSIGLKEGAWPILSSFHPGLMELPIHQRQDGKKIRYLPPVNLPQQAVPDYPVKQIIFPRYQASKATSIRPISRAEALYRIAEGGYNVNGHLNTATVSELVRWIGGIKCYEICYSSLPEALSHVAELISIQ